MSLAKRAKTLADSANAHYITEKRTVMGATHRPI